MKKVVEGENAIDERYIDAISALIAGAIEKRAEIVLSDNDKDYIRDTLGEVSDGLFYQVMSKRDINPF